MKFKILIEKDEDGVYIVKVPDLPGCVTEGRTKKEALKNAREAIRAYLEALKKHKEPVPVEVAHISISV
jgi:predicted RNase H-like HicB family nuclease